MTEQNKKKWDNLTDELRARRELMDTNRRNVGNYESALRDKGNVFLLFEKFEHKHPVLYWLCVIVSLIILLTTINYL